MKKGNSGIFFIILLVSVLITVILCILFAKRDVDEYQQMQETINSTQEQVDDMGDAMQEFRNQTQEGYEELDQQLDGGEK